MLNLNFRNGNTPALNARNLNAIVETINTMQTQLANPFTFKGSVSSVANLPSSGNTVNDTYYVTAATCLYTWDGNSWEVSSLSESDYLAELQKAVQYRGILNTTTVTPDTVEDIGYWTANATTVGSILGKTSAGGVFFNLRQTPNDFQQMFILVDGTVLARYQKQGEFVSHNISIQRDPLSNPDAVAENGIYTSPASVTAQYTGVNLFSMFVCLTSPGNAVVWQGFLLTDGRVFSRYGNSGDFACQLDSRVTSLENDVAEAKPKIASLESNSFQRLGNLSLADGGLTPDNVPATPGYYISPESVTYHYTGLSQQAIFLVFATPGGNVGSQVFVLPSGMVFSRTGNTGDFSQIVDKTLTRTGYAADAKVTGDTLKVAFQLRGNLSLVDGGLTPENVPATPGYYISPGSITQEYTGVYDTCVFVNYSTPANAYAIQSFILSDGRTFSRAGNSGVFTNITEKKMANKNVYFSSSSSATTGASDSNGGLLNCFIPYGGEKHFKASFIHGTRPDWQTGESMEYKNEDVYRFDSGSVGTINGFAYTGEFQLITPGAWDGATYTSYNTTTLAPSGIPVGTFHGWEKYTKCIIQVDGKTVANLSPGNTLPNINMTPCENIDIFYWANIYSIGTSTLLANTYKRYTVKADGVHCYTRYKWATSGNRAMYVAMGCVSRALTNRAISDYDCELYDISNASVTPITTIANNKPNITRCVEFGLSNSAKCEINVDEPLYMYIQNNIDGATYNKIYFNNHGTVSNGDVWEFKFDFKFGGGTSV